MSVNLRRKHKAFERALRKRFGSLPPHFKFRVHSSFQDTFNSIRLPAGYTKPTQSELETQFNSEITEEETRAFREIKGDTRITEDLEVDGAVNLAGTLTTSGDITMSSGTLTTSGDITMSSGTLTTSGDITMSSGTLTTGAITRTAYNPGEIIEALHARADGSSIQVLSGTYTLQNVTGAQDLGTSHTVITGSSISYKPPPGTTRVMYEFYVYTRKKDPDVIIHIAGRISGTQVSHSRHTLRSRDHEQQWTYSNMTITIGEVASDNLAAGKLASWTTNKTLDFTCRDYSGSYEAYLHRTDHWDGGGTDITVTPVIKITAIA